MPVFLMKNITLLLLILGIAFGTLIMSEKARAQSATLNDVTDIISTDTVDATGVNHTVAFTMPSDALSVDFSDYIQISLPNFTSVTTATSLSGQYSGTPVYSIDGTTVKITGIFVLPGKQITVNGITATNPSVTNGFGVVVSVTEDEAGTLTKNIGTTSASTTLGTVTVSAELDVAQATIRITGFTGPQTYVSFTEGENVIGTDVSSSLGVFNKYFTAVQPGTHEISLYGVDTNNRATSIVPLTISAPAYQTTTVSNLLLSPTLEINSTEIDQGDPLYATGSAYPNTTVTIFTDTPLRTYTATASAAGAWTTTISDTADYTPGDYRLYALAQSGGLQSLTSRKLVFTIVDSAGAGSGTACGDISQGDLNCDASINLTDFSILMYYWGTANATADVDSSGGVDLTDFSILMYYWGT